MKKYLLILLSMMTVCIYSCNDDDDSPQSRIVGTWVGTEFPDNDTIFFYDNEIAMIVGRGGPTTLSEYSIDNEKITFTSTSNSTISTEHSYDFLPDDKIYIKRIRAVIPPTGDGGIEYQKIE